MNRVSLAVVFLYDVLIQFSADELIHLPDVGTLDGLLDLISGCTFAILANVLDFRTYSAPNQHERDRTTKAQRQLWEDFDRNAIPGDERMAMCHARGVALVVFGWIRDCCIVQTPDGEVIDDLPSKYAVNMLDALIGYKEKADARSLKGAPHCEQGMLEAQISNVAKCDELVEGLLGKGTKGHSTNLKLNLDERCMVQWKENVPAISLPRKFHSHVYFAEAD